MDRPRGDVTARAAHSRPATDAIRKAGSKDPTMNESLPDVDPARHGETAWSLARRHASLETGVVLGFGDIHPSGSECETFREQLPGTAVVTDQAVLATGLDLAAIGEPVPTPPLRDSGPLLHREGPYDLSEQEPIAVRRIEL
jgi:hypothetical protein